MLYNAIPINTYGDPITYVDIQVSGPFTGFHFTDPLSALVLHWSGYAAVQIGTIPGVFSDPQIVLWGILNSDISIPGIIPLTTDPFYVYGYFDPSGNFYQITGGQIVSPVPEPSSILLLGSALLGLIGFTRKLRK